MTHTFARNSVLWNSIVANFRISGMG